MTGITHYDMTNDHIQHVHVLMGDVSSDLYSYLNIKIKHKNTTLSQQFQIIIDTGTPYTHIVSAMSQPSTCTSIKRDYYNLGNWKELKHTYTPGCKPIRNTWPLSQ